MGILWIIPQCLIAQNPDACVGYWKTIDDETKKVRSIVQIYKVGNVYEGKIIKVFWRPEEDPNKVCEKCSSDDPRYKKPIVGMVILKDLVWDADDDEWDDGNILDPNNGSVYSCYMEQESADKLKLRGYIGVSLLGRTQYWQRTEKP